MKMMDIPDHPAIACCLRTGYPEPEDDLPRCYDCNDVLIDQEAFDWDGEQVCASCLKDRIEEQICIEDIADALNIAHRRM